MKVAEEWCRREHNIENPVCQVTDNAIVIPVVNHLCHFCHQLFCSIEQAFQKEAKLVMP